MASKEGRPKTTEMLLEKLKTHLEEKHAEWKSQPLPPEERTPTLPHLPDGKINVTALAREIGLTAGQSQYLHRPEWKAVVTPVAEEQGLLSIGARKDAATKKTREEIKRRTAMADRMAKESQGAAVEAIAKEEGLIEDLRLAHATIAEQAALITRLQAQLALVQNGILVEVQ